MIRALTVDPWSCRSTDLVAAADWLRSGGIVAFPTDTFYGLAVDPTSETAVQALFAIKGRSARVAVPLVAASLAHVERVCGALDGLSLRLARAFWPGPLSLVLDAPAACVPAVHAGAGTVAVRVPDHAVAQALAEACGGLVTATSANRSGVQPARQVSDLSDLLNDARLMVIDGGATAGGQPSTIVDVRRGPPVLVREGMIAWSRVLESLDR